MEPSGNPKTCIPPSDHELQRELTLATAHTITLGSIVQPSHAPTSPVQTPLPSGLSYEELIILVRDALHDCRQNGSIVAGRPGSAFPTLLNVLLERHFLSTHLSLPLRQDDDVDRTVRCLLSVCQQPLGQTPITGISISRATVLRLLDELPTLLPPELEPDPSGVEEHFRSLYVFCANLVAGWNLQITYRQDALKWSPFPWSTHSLTLGIPPPPSAYDYQAAQAPRPSYDDPLVKGDLVFFPDMNWLDGPHDGYCRSTSPTAYVWIRLHAAKSPQQYVALWQSALTFGVLEAITGFAIPEHLLLSTTPDGSLVFTSEAVSQLVTTWLSMGSVGHDNTQNTRQLDHAWETVTWALLAIDEAAKDLDRGIFGDAELATNEAEDIVCSLFTLYEFLYHYFIAILLGTQNDTERYQQRPCPPCTAAEDATKNACSRRMADGWCLYTLRLLASINNQLLLRASFSPPHLRTPTEHAACTKDGCVGDNIETASYTTRHTPECADPTLCPFLKPSLSDVLHCLSSGEIPVVVYEHGALTTRTAADGPYTAISHVWADGLGSTTEDGLPACQISRVAAHARQLEPGGAFWVDSLCVPAVKELRKRAIRLMAETYERAAEVVVFDAGIRAYCTSATAPRDVFMRITASSWMRRVWTLQEALLARELYFEFSDGLFPIGRLVEARSAAFELIPSAYGPIQRDLSTALFCTGNLTSIMDRGSQAFSFQDVASMLTGRTTSHPEDETVAVAGLLGVDVARLLTEQDAYARMRVFLEETKTLPADVLFSPVPKLPFRGFRWAARTLRSLHEMSSRHGAAQCTPEGLATEREFALVRLPATHIGSDEETTPIIVSDITKSKTYALVPNDKTRVRGMAMVPNAIVAPRGALELLSGDLDSARWVNAACVHVPSILHDLSPPNGPVRCEYLFHVVMSVFETSPLSLEGQLTPPEAATLFNWPHVELQSVMANRIIVA